MLPSKSFRVGFGPEDETFLQLFKPFPQLGILIFGFENLDLFSLSVISDPGALWKTETALRVNSKRNLFSVSGLSPELALIFRVGVVQNINVCPSLSPFFLLSLLLCGRRTTRSGGSPSSWRCRTRARTCWLQTARPRWRIGSTHSTRSCTAALRSPCRRRGTETFTTVCVYTASVGTWVSKSYSKSVKLSSNNNDILIRQYSDSNISELIVKLSLQTEHFKQNVEEL